MLNDCIRSWKSARSRIQSRRCLYPKQVPFRCARPAPRHHPERALTTATINQTRRRANGIAAILKFPSKDYGDATVNFSLRSYHPRFPLPFQR